MFYPGGASVKTFASGQRQFGRIAAFFSLLLPALLSCRFVLAALPVDDYIDGNIAGSYRTGLTAAGLVSVEDLGDSHLWLGVRTSFDRNTKFDVRVELLNNGETVAAGYAYCIGDIGSRPGQAGEVVVPWEDFNAVPLSVGDVLEYRVSVRLGTDGEGRACSRRRFSGGLRLFYDAAQRDSGFAATVTPDPEVALYLRDSAQVRNKTIKVFGSALTLPFRECNIPSAEIQTDLILGDAEPAAGPACRADSGWLAAWRGNTWREMGTWSLEPQCDCDNSLIPVVRENPPAPEPETVELSRLPLPPPPNGSSCLNATGCITGVDHAGGYIDANHATAVVSYAGLPGTLYSGDQLIAIKTNGESFPNGDPWKCLSCGIPAANGGAGASGPYPQPFQDGHRILVGTQILQCDFPWISESCTPEVTHRYNIQEPPSGSMRELRIHPDDVHLGWSTFYIGAKLDQFMYYGRLAFVGGANPRYVLQNINLMYDPAQPQAFYVNPDDPTELLRNPLVNEIGEFRGWSKDGQWAAYIGFPEESNRIDIFMTHIETGEIRRLTRHPGYVDPMDISYDNRWVIHLDTRPSFRQRFWGEMPGIPPVNDLVSTGVVASTRNDGNRRFFQPILIDIFGDRGDYEGQLLKSCNGEPGRTGVPGDLCDLDWNASADPRWSQDGTSLVYKELQNGSGNLEVGNRRSRLIIARFPDREPQPFSKPGEAPDFIPWATAWYAGLNPVRTLAPEGTYTLNGKVFGSAMVTIEHATVSSRFGSAELVSLTEVAFNNYSDDGVSVINGIERAERLPTSSAFTPDTLFDFDLTLIGCKTGTKLTSEDGYRVSIGLLNNVLRSSGTLTTTINGVSYSQPPSLPIP